MVKYLVTGGPGFIGSHLVRALVNRGDEVVSFNRIADEATGSGNRVIFVKGDVRDSRLLTKTLLEHRPDVAIHLASITGIKSCIDNPQESFDINVYGTYNIVMASIQSKSKLIFASSREVYGETTNAETPEDSILAPNNLYGVTKMLGENIIMWAGKKHRLNYTILRFTNVYGPGGDKYGVQTIIQKALKGDRLQVLGGDQTMNFVYIDDVVRALLLTAENEKSCNEIFNVGSYDTVSVYNLIQKIIRFVGKKVEIEKGLYRETETLYFKPDLEKIKRILGWSPQINLDAGLLRTIEYYKKKMLHL